MSLVVNEIFHSIQGESLYAGRPCIFIRLTGCNLRCSYCDTDYAYTEGTVMSVTDIITSVTPYNCSLVEITGGEPLLQKNTPKLIRELISSGYTVLVETNGSKNIDFIDSECIKIVDIKCPSSGESESNDLGNIQRLRPHDQLKFVIGSRDDFCFAEAIIRNEAMTVPDGNILMSPISGILDPAELAEWILKSGLNVRLQLQMHKIIWPDTDRGV